MNSTIDPPLIAMVDDNEAVRIGIQRMLRAYGMDAAVFASSGAFIATLDAEPSWRPACVILDVQMPEMDGLEVQKLLASKRPGIPVVFITADPGLLKSARSTAAAAVLEKPVDASVLISILRWILKSDPGQGGK
jgi:FixJ family two-component response regulator